MLLQAETSKDNYLSHRFRAETSDPRRSALDSYDDRRSEASSNPYLHHVPVKKKKLRVLEEVSVVKSSLGNHSVTSAGQHKHNVSMEEGKLEAALASDEKQAKASARRMMNIPKTKDLSMVVSRSKEAEAEAQDFLKQIGGKLTGRRAVLGLKRDLSPAPTSGGTIQNDYTSSVKASQRLKLENYLK